MSHKKLVNSSKTESFLARTRYFVIHSGPRFTESRFCSIPIRQISKQGNNVIFFRLPIPSQLFSQISLLKWSIKGLSNKIWQNTMVVKESVLWDYFKRSELLKDFASCNICKREVSTGSLTVKPGHVRYVVKLCELFGHCMSHIAALLTLPNNFLISDNYLPSQVPTGDLSLHLEGNHPTEYDRVKMMKEESAKHNPVLVPGSGKCLLPSVLFQIVSDHLFSLTQLNRVQTQVFYYNKILHKDAQ